MHSSVHPPPPPLSTVPCCACSPLPAPRGVRPGQTNTCSPVSDAPAGGQVDMPWSVGSRPGFQRMSTGGRLSLGRTRAGGVAGVPRQEAELRKEMLLQPGPPHQLWVNCLTHAPDQAPVQFRTRQLSCGCCEELPRTEWIQTTRTYFVLVLEVKNLKRVLGAKIEVSAGLLPSEVLEENVSLLIPPSRGLLGFCPSLRLQKASL